MWHIVSSWILPVAGGALTRLIVAAAFINVLALTVPVFVLQVYDRVVFFQGHSTLVGLTAGVAVALIFELLFRLVRSRMLQSAALRLDVTLGRAIFDRLTGLSLRQIEARDGADWQGRFHDMNFVRNCFAGPPLVNCIDVLFAALFLLVIALIAPPVAWVVLAIVPLFLLVSLWSGIVVSAASKQERESHLGRDALIAELTSARQTVKSLALDSSMREIWADKHAVAVEQSHRRGGRGDVFQNIAYSLSMLATVGLTSVGAIAIMGNQLSIGALIAANMLASRIYSPFVQLVATWRAFSDGRQAAKRLATLFALDQELQDSPLEMIRPEGKILLEKITFSYNAARPALAALDLAIGPNGLHAISGISGSGKSTMLKMISGLYRPDDGRVVLDEADIGQYSRLDLARFVGYLPQEIVLFAGSLRDNFILAKDDASDDEIRLAAERAGALGFINDLPDGFGTDIGEWGHRLSGGQRQRIALARCFLNDPPVILLDEPTSHLDPNSEQGLAETLKDLSRSRTIIVVTHSLQLMQRADSISVMEAGKIVLSGPAERVLQRLTNSPPKAPETKLPETRTTETQVVTPLPARQDGGP